MSNFFPSLKIINLSDQVYDQLIVFNSIGTKNTEVSCMSWSVYCCPWRFCLSTFPQLPLPWALSLSTARSRCWEKRENSGKHRCTSQIPSCLQLFAARQLPPSHSPLGSSPAELTLHTAVSVPLLQNSGTHKFWDIEIKNCNWAFFTY